MATTTPHYSTLGNNTAFNNNRTTNTSNASSSASSSTLLPATKPEAVTVAFTVGNTYQRLSPSEARYDRLTGRHLKIHDWTLYVDVLPGHDPDIIDRVTFDMRDDSFATTAFTCHCPIRIASNYVVGNSSFTGRMTGINNRNNSQKNQIGQSTKEGEGPSTSAAAAATTSVATAAAVVVTNKRPHPSKSRWRFSTRQQTFGAVDVQINIRGRGGCRCTIPYKITLSPGGYECPLESLPLFIEKRPHQQLKPLKMMDSSFSLDMYFGWLDNNDGSDVVASKSKVAAKSSSLYETAKSVYSRSKLPIRLVEEDGQVKYFANKPKKSSSLSSSTASSWLIQLVKSASNGSQKRSTTTDAIDATIIAMSSPNLTGGHGLNECYKIIEGLPPSCMLSIPSSSRNSNHNGAATSASAYVPTTTTTTSIHVQIDVSKLSTQQIIKVCQNYIKYEESMDSFMPWHRREDLCKGCRSNKQAMMAAHNGKYTTNKQRNLRISKCVTLEELVDCLNPTTTTTTTTESPPPHYKLNLQRLLNVQGDDNTTTHHHLRHSSTRQQHESQSSMSTPPPPTIRILQFRQHPSSKDKTTITHWIRFCTAFVRNSARLRSPAALKATTSIEEEFDLMFEYVVKDRALRNFYGGRREKLIAEEEREREERILEARRMMMVKKKSQESSVGIVGGFGDDNGGAGSYDSSMSISDGSGNEGSSSAAATLRRLPAVRKRSYSISSQPESKKRTCL